MDVSPQVKRQAYSHWLRTGRWPVARGPDGIELKFNPYHDPRNGRFTFAPGGAGGGRDANYVRPGPRQISDPNTGGGEAGQAILPDSVKPAPANQIRPPAGPGRSVGRGSNSRAFEDPMTLEQAFPGLEGSARGAILTAADHIFDLTGPASEAQIAVLNNWSREIIAQIKSIDPSWHYDRLGPALSVKGWINELNDLRFHRAAVLLRVKDDTGALQVETLRFVQHQTDIAYRRGLARARAGQLKIRLSDREGLGSYIDTTVRRSLRLQYNRFGIDWAGIGPVRVNKKEINSSDLTYRRPDARVGDVAFDVTLARKTLATSQVRGFFDADFRPSRVVIIRPRQEGPDATYAITRPEAER